MSTPQSIVRMSPLLEVDLQALPARRCLGVPAIMES